MRNTVLVVVVIALLVAVTLRRTPARELRLVNNTEFVIDVDVTGAERDGWIPLTVLGPESSAEVSGVVDQGDVWVFRFSSARVAGGSTELRREELVANDWVVAVPSEVAERLRDAGIPAAPRR